jgi:hypothetical protein
MLVAIETLGYASTLRYARAYDYDGGSAKPELHVTWMLEAPSDIYAWNPADAGNNIVIDEETFLIATHHG